jgi:hypothetical protein
MQTETFFLEAVEGSNESSAGRIKDVEVDTRANQKRLFLRNVGS